MKKTQTINNFRLELLKEFMGDYKGTPIDKIKSVGFTVAVGDDYIIITNDNWYQKTNNDSRASNKSLTLMEQAVFDFVVDYTDMVLNGEPYRIHHPVHENHFNYWLVAFITAVVIGAYIAFKHPIS